MQRYTLTYTTREGRGIRLINLGKIAAEQIQRAQIHLGSHSFQLILQPGYEYWGSNRI